MMPETTRKPGRPRQPRDLQTRFVGTEPCPLCHHYRPLVKYGCCKVCHERYVLWWEKP